MLIINSNFLDTTQLSIFDLVINMYYSFFFVEKEADKALAILKENGVGDGDIEEYSGDLPVWKLSCGPYNSKKEAGDVAALLRKKKIVDAVVTRIK